MQSWYWNPLSSVTPTFRRGTWCTHHHQIFQSKYIPHGVSNPSIRIASRNDCKDSLIVKYAREVNQWSLCEWSWFHLLTQINWNLFIESFRIYIFYFLQSQPSLLTILIIIFSFPKLGSKINKNIISHSLFIIELYYKCKPKPSNVYSTVG